MVIYGFRAKITIFEFLPLGFDVLLSESVDLDHCVCRREGVLDSVLRVLGLLRICLWIVVPGAARHPSRGEIAARTTAYEVTLYSRYPMLRISRSSATPTDESRPAPDRRVASAT